MRGQGLSPKADWFLQSDIVQLLLTMSFYFLCSGLVFISLGKARRCTLYRRAHCTKRCVLCTCIIFVILMKAYGQAIDSILTPIKEVMPTQQTSLVIALCLHTWSCV